MRKIFSLLCLFGVLSVLNSQDSEKSESFNDIQKKIESLKARMSLLQQNEKVFPKIQKTVSLTTETSEQKEDSRDQQNTNYQSPYLRTVVSR